MKDEGCRLPTQQHRVCCSTKGLDKHCSVPGVGICSVASLLVTVATATEKLLPSAGSVLGSFEGGKHQFSEQHQDGSRLHPSWLHCLPSSNGQRAPQTIQGILEGGKCQLADEPSGGPEAIEGRHCKLDCQIMEYGHHQQHRQHLGLTWDSSISARVIIIIGGLLSVIGELAR